ncbi:MULTISPECIES: alpha/beta fold hydrolase [Rhodococcus]|uniref:Alpha/beta fold hydrolase n=1 Tax=Rhodococcus oxybenzonivorans TaxID=1990687 RepID=A0AAE4UZQ3_9NOCA|nr:MULTISPECIES: alpha/beta fold hydrolase [Rhodococcus]MDV7243452.1 alpha/beta fold hydrolase [Rhodococcus oxybenzonivorans]MDV7265158.1 alpha/beta fold hydrolase [Rhodococcus oxybenzonivorans]MDV7277428.1 alpha/beta fold hydrolase [Rhodococcus oxybenzonivorans]MDV7335544.1 alpha/beta fold hydrolase [Rhodococcus oxybenzonivorans]MDV7347140.1 alpha/beta fold hydrolase [Rhodococcus oxybenzonivorans]
MSSDAVVLLHGLGGSPSTWDRVRPLLPGSVLTPRVSGAVSIEQDALDVARAMRSAGHTSATVVGHSRGGLVATSLAEQFPALVNRLVLVSTPPTVASRLTARELSEAILRVPALGAAVWKALPARSLRRGLRSAFAPGGPVPDFAVRDLAETGIGRFRSSTTAIDHYLEESDLADRLVALTCPIELVYGLDDRRVDPVAMARCAAGPEIDAFPLRHEGHGAPWSSAGAVAAVITGRAWPSAAAGQAEKLPPRLHPVRWTPPRATPRARETASADPVRGIRRIELPGRGPEDVRVDSLGRIVTGVEDGRILRVTITDGDATVETLADTGGRPLGMTVVDDATLLVCDSERGLLRVDLDTGAVDVLLDSLDGEPITFASNVVRAASGRVYFTVSTRRFGFHDFLGDLLEHSGTGRIVVLEPDRSARVLHQGIQFANGLTVSDAEDLLIVCETGDFRVMTYPLADGAVGTPRVLVDNLPGFPDNMSVDGDLTWVAMATPRSALFDRVAPLPGVLRRLAYSLPERVRSGASTTWVIAVDGQGAVVHDLQTSSPEYSMVTSVVRRGPHLVLGSITESALAVIDLPSTFSKRVGT